MLVSTQSATSEFGLIWYGRAVMMVVVGSKGAEREEEEEEEAILD
jgi:hypothetical protein